MLRRVRMAGFDFVEYIIGSPVTDLIVLVTTPALLTICMASLFSMNAFIDALIWSFICFIISIIADHIILFFRRSVYDRNILRYIDYVYLTVALIGVVSASDFSSREYKAEAQTAVSRAIQTFTNFPKFYDAAYKGFCEDGKLSKSCNVFSELKEQAANIVDELDETHNASEGLFLVRKFNTTLNSDARLSQYFGSQEIFYPRFEEYVLSRFEKAPYSFDGPDWANLRIFGFFLVFSALALRITRVTVELKQWHMP